MSDFEAMRHLALANFPMREDPLLDPMEGVMVDDGNGWPTLVVHPILMLVLKHPGMSVWEAFQRRQEEWIATRARAAEAKLDVLTERFEQLHDAVAELRAHDRLGHGELVPNPMLAMHRCPDCWFEITDQALHGARSLR